VIRVWRASVADVAAIAATSVVGVGRWLLDVVRRADDDLADFGGDD